MFCSNCGAEIDNSSRFCYRCGVEIKLGKVELDDRFEFEDIDIKKAIKEKKNSSFPKREFHLFDKTVSISEGHIKYIEIKRKYYPIIEEILGDNKKDLENISLNSNPQKLINVCREIGSKCIREIENTMYSFFSENGIYNITFRNYTDYLSDISEVKSWVDSINRLQVKVNNIDTKKKSVKMQREFNKVTRARYIGGGFGLVGATKGIITAGVLNTATGIGYSVFNSVANIGTEINANYKKNDLMKYNHVVSNFLVDLRTSMISVVDNTLKYFADESKDQLFEVISDEDEEYFEAILNNIERTSISDIEKKKLLQKCIEINPFKQVSYFLILMDYPEEYRNIKSIAEEVDLDFAYIMEEVLNELYLDEIEEIIKPLDDFYLRLPGSMSVQEMQEMLQEIQNAKNYIDQLVGKFGFNQDELKDAYSILLQPCVFDAVCGDIVELEEIHRGYYQMYMCNDKIAYGEYQLIASYEDVFEIKKIQEQIELIFEKVDLDNTTDISMALVRIKEIDKETKYAKDIIQYLEYRLNLYGNTVLTKYEDAMIVHKKIPYSSLKSTENCNEAMLLLSKINISEETKRIVEREISSKLYQYEEDDLKLIIQDAKNTEGVTAENFNKYVEIYSDFMYKGNHVETVKKLEQSLKKIVNLKEEEKSLGSTQMGVGVAILVIVIIASGFISRLPLIIKIIIYCYAGLAVYAQIFGGRRNKLKAKDWIKKTDSFKKILYSNNPEIYSKLQKDTVLMLRTSKVERTTEMQNKKTEDIERRLCPICGGVLKAGKQFCSQCGTKV